MFKKKTKALVLFSGGLDSILAVKILEEQKIDARGICFCSNFFDCGKARESAKALGIKLHTFNIREKMLELVKDPPHGHGANMNPCIDCHANMIKLADEYARDMFGDNYIIATGEVLGQRPFSQNKQALEVVKKTSGVEVLRPLSAKFLPQTSFEERGLVDRSKLGEISGRSRSAQLTLAKKYGIKDIPSPAGGCLLTETEISKKISEMIKNVPNCTSDDIELLKSGRVFWTEEEGGKILIVVGRDERDNEKLEKLAKKGDIVVQLKEETGPLTLIRKFFKVYKEDWQELIDKYRNFDINIPSDLKIDNIEYKRTPGKNIEIAGLLTGWYATKVRGEEVEIEIDKR